MDGRNVCNQNSSVFDHDEISSCDKHYCEGACLLMLLMLLMLVATVLYRIKLIGGKFAPETNDLAEWKRRIKEWYPDLHKKTYFLPPLFFHTDNLVERSGFMKPLLVKKVSSTHDSDERGDLAQEEVLRQLRMLSNNLENKAMMIISQLQFGTYFSEASYTPAAACFLKNKTKPLPKRQEGDFDIIIIHPSHGIIIGEIKSVGAVRSDQLLQCIQERVKKAIYQLAKSKDVICYIVDDTTKVNVMKTIFLPFISSEEFVRAVVEDEELLMDLRTALGTDFPEDVCFFQDTPVEDWWSRLTSSQKTESPMTESQYEDYVVRFCGPARTSSLYCVTPPRLELRTEAEGVAETGNRIARFILLDSQLEFINMEDNANPLVFLTGPPGTGKTVVLIFKAMKWLQNGHTVHLVSSWYKSLPSTYLIEHQLLMTTDKTKIILHTYNFACDQNVEKAIDELTKARNENELQRLFVIVDEAGPDLREDALRMFPKENGVYTYRKPMGMEIALHQLQERFYLNREQANLLVIKLSQESDHKLDLDNLHKFYIEYTIANRLRQEHGQSIFQKCVQTEKCFTEKEATFLFEDMFLMRHNEAEKKVHELTREQTGERLLTYEEFKRVYEESEVITDSRTKQACSLFNELKGKVEKVLTKTDAISLLERRLKCKADEIDAEFNEKINNEHMNVTDFKRIYFTHEKAEELRKNHIRSLFPSKYRDEKSLQRSDAINVLKEMFSLSDDNKAEQMYREVGKYGKGQFSEGLFQQFYFKADDQRVKDHRENHAECLYSQYFRYHARYLKVSEIRRVLPQVIPAYEEALSSSFPEDQDKYLNEDDFTKLYVDNSSLRQLETKHQFELCLEKYKRTITKSNLLSALETRNQSLCAVKDAISEISEQRLDILLFRRFYAQNANCIEHYTRTKFEESKGHKTKNGISTLPKSSAIELLKTNFGMVEETALDTFKKIVKAGGNKLTFEEFQNFYSTYSNASRENNFSLFCEGLLEKVPSMCIWAATIRRHTKPICLTEEAMDISLRTTPNVTKKVSGSNQIKLGYVLDYTSSSGVAGNDGPEPIHRSHNVTNEENKDLLQDCEECGRNIAEVLTSLNIGKRSSQSSPSLQYSDVLVLCEKPLDDEGNERASGLVRALRTKYPVRVVPRKFDRLKIKETVLASSNEVTVSHYRHAHGLERKVVVVVGNPGVENDFSRLYNMTRTTSQLVLIEHTYNNA